MSIEVSARLLSPKSYEGTWNGTHTNGNLKFKVEFYEVGVKFGSKEALSQSAITNRDMRNQPAAYLGTSGHGQYTLDENGRMTKWESSFAIDVESYTYNVTDIVFEEDQTTIASIKGNVGGSDFVLVR